LLAPKSLDITVFLLKLIHRECGHTPEKRPNPAPAGPCPFSLLG